MHELLARLTEPFEPKHVTFKPGATKDNKCLALAFADLRAYQNRLDEVCGLDWSIRYAPWGDGRIICELTIAGVTRSSTGEHDEQDTKNGMAGTVAEAQAMKRAAAQFGLGRYLYDLPSVWVEFDPQRKRITEAGQKELDSRYVAWYARKMAQKSQKPAEVDNPWVPTGGAKQPDKLSQAQMTKLHVLGADVYGKRWDTERPLLVAEVSGGAYTSAKELTPDEATVLIRQLEAELKHAQNGKIVA